MARGHADFAMEKIVIYTCITGGYDKLLQPAAVDTDFDFVCFVGNGEKSCGRIGVWEIRELPAELPAAIASGCTREPSAQNRTLASRYPKMHPHLLLPEYEASVWVDGNIQLQDGTVFGAARRKFAEGVLYSGVQHRDRHNPYSEALMCMKMGYFSFSRYLRLLVWLALHPSQRNAGLQENNLIFRRHNDPRIVALDELWWKKLLSVCRRDQITFMWCLRKCGIPVDYFLGEGINTRNSPGFKYLLHGK